ncbi:hypothetical protein [Thioflexithrix psekupsensis]|uniref:RND transporter n=1 Tax=Thioflexithrix psekupsensis TaxID=1570016 RepID=A0A251X875_9GAMM|nr:hypothetical protein [Thioflexithrix psekupsensis]OUD14130.1 hypothetical protein TPSD3_07285 [Thioflexithrix psekupsensis]
MLRWLDDVPWFFIMIACLTLGLAPFVPEPHLVEKVRMLFQGTLHRLIDIFDLLMHASPFILAIMKGIRTQQIKANNNISNSDMKE